jgi:hypothetical protein
MNNNDMGLKCTDVVASALKSVAGAVPGVGSLLSEIIGNIVPNQRIDRLEKFVKILDDRIGLLQGKIRECIADDECIRLIEEALYQASRSTSDERRIYIASILESGLQDDRIKFEESRYLMNILDELTDVEIVWLRSYLVPTLGGDEEFRDKHQSVLEQVVLTLGCDKETREKGALQGGYKVHLKNLGLIRSRARTDRAGVPIFDKHTGEPETSYTEITSLGRLLLKKIGFKELEE